MGEYFDRPYGSDDRNDLFDGRRDDKHPQEIDGQSLVSREVLNQMAEGVFICDKKNLIVFWSKGAERITGHPSREVEMLQTCQALFNPVNEEGRSICQTECPGSFCRQTGQPGRSRGFIHHRGGYRIAVSFEVNPVFDKSGSIVATMGFFKRFDVGYRSVFRPMICTKNGVGRKRQNRWTILG